MEHLRSRLKNSLQLTGMTPFTFAFNCGLKNSQTITKFLEGQVKPHKASIQKIEEELKRMGAEDAEQTAESIKPTDQLGINDMIDAQKLAQKFFDHVSTGSGENDLDDPFLTQKERLVLVTQIMNTNYNLMTLDEKTALIGKLDLI